jgi:hypothetical protein
MWIWDRIRGVGGKRDEQADEREEYGGTDPGGEEEKYLAETGYGTGLAGGEAAEVARDDLAEFEPPKDPAP